MTVSAKLPNDMVMSRFHNYVSKIPSNGVLSRTLVCLLVHLALADLRRKGAMEACPTLSVRFCFNFMQFSGKMAQIIGWCWCPSSGKSWICHCLIHHLELCFRVHSSHLLPNSISLSFILFGCVHFLA